MRRLAAALLALALMAAAPAPMAQLGWLAGSWQEIKGARWTEEVWLPPRGNSMIGMARNGEAGAMVSFEFTRIEAGPDGVPVFWASPMGRSAVPFRMVRQTATSIMFENPGNDFPQRVSYRRNGDALDAEISAIDGTRVFRWRYRRLR